MLNKQSGNMYPFVTHTWNPIKGKCPHQCIYCYYQANPRYSSQIGELRLDEKCLRDNLGEDRVIFVGSSTDIWATDVPMEWIEWVVDHCQLSDFNDYYFQTKNPDRFWELVEYYDNLVPSNFKLGVTIETTERFFVSSVPPVWSRYEAMLSLSGYVDVFVSIEPIMDFDLEVFPTWISNIKPKFVSIGADSKKHNLPEPSREKTKALITELEKFTEVKIKTNLERILK